MGSSLYIHTEIRVHKKTPTFNSNLYLLAVKIPVFVILLYSFYFMREELSGNAFGCQNYQSIESAGELADR